MVFSSTVFLFLFFPAVLIAYYNPIIKSREFKNIILFLASIVFYAWGEPVFVFFMLFSVGVTWYIGLLLQRLQRKSILAVGILYHVIILFVFKYMSFFSKQLGVLLNNDEITVSIALPIGISFFTFQLMSYLFDIYYKKADAQKNPLYIGLYVMMFPQLIAGPIVRYERIAEQITERSESYANISAGFRRFVYGLGKKMLISNYMAQIADEVFAYPGQNPMPVAWLGAIAYSFQIYFDFSGYSDMAIGLGKIFGFDFDENFNYPYISKSITEFWRRWHISLSSWFRDYVYIPLGGNRLGKPGWIRNLFIVWFLTGVWHGANWTFIVWGLIWFVFLLIEKLTGVVDKAGRWSYIYAWGIIILSWVVFRAESISDAILYIKNMFCVNVVNPMIYQENWSGTLVFIGLAIIASTPVPKRIFSALEDKGCGFIEQIWVLVIFLLSIIQVVSASYSPFIYFIF